MDPYQCNVSLPFYASDDKVGVTYHAAAPKGLIPLLRDGVEVGKVAVDRRTTVGYLYEQVHLALKVYVEDKTIIDKLRCGEYIPQPVSRIEGDAEIVSHIMLV